MTDLLGTAMSELADDFEKVQRNVDRVREALIAERVAPHPSLVRVQQLDDLTRQLIGRMHYAATELHKGGAHKHAAALRKAAREASDRKHEIFGERMPEPEHAIDVVAHGTKFIPSCRCGWAAGVFPAESEARQYGELHVEHFGKPALKAVGGERA